MKYFIIFIFMFKTFAVCDYSYVKAPELLSQTCLYQKISAKILNPNVYTFKPQFELWSDGAKKNRWVYLPQNAKIITADKDNWQFPVGTIFYKEFSKNGKRLETRVFKKINTQPSGSWIFGTYKWRDDESDADYLESGFSSARGEDHDIPSMNECKFCHAQIISDNNGGYLRDMSVKGFDAINLAQISEKIQECDTFINPNPSLSNDAQTIDLKWLVNNKKVSDNYDWQSSIPQIVGPHLQKEALGYLHTNCASCHSDRGQVQGLGMNLYHKIDQSIDQLPAYVTSFNISTRVFRTSQNMMRIAPNDLNNSAIWIRLNSEVPGVRMPRFGTKKIDPYGVCVLKKWIESF